MLNLLLILYLLGLFFFLHELHDDYAICLYVETTQTFPPAFFKLLDSHEMELCLMELSSLVRTLFFFTFSSISDILLECWISCLDRSFSKGNWCQIL